MMVWSYEQLIALTKYPKEIVYSVHEHLMTFEGKNLDYDAFIAKIENRIKLTHSAQDDQPRYEHPPVEKTKRRRQIYPAQEFVPAPARDDNERKQELNKMIESQGISESKVPPVNTPEYFAHILAYGTRK